MVAVETRAADNTEKDEEEAVVEEKVEEGRGLRVVQEAMSKLFAYTRRAVVVPGAMRKGGECDAGGRGGRGRGGGEGRMTTERWKRECHNGRHGNAALTLRERKRERGRGRRRKRGELRERKREKPSTQGLYFHNLPLCRF